MPIKQIVLAIVISSLLILGFALAQLEGLGSFLQPILSQGEGEFFFLSEEGGMSNGGVGQTMTEMDSGGNLASGAEYSGSDIDMVAGEIPLIIGSGGSTGAINSGILSDSVSRLILSEVYYDGTDEWIEITNIGEGDFQGNITLSGVKSTPVSLNNISLLSGESKVFGDTLVQISGTAFIGKTGLAFSMTDTAKISIYLIVSGQIEDSFIVDQYWVNKYNDKKTSFEKVAELSTWVQSDRVAHAQLGYTINPGMYFATGIVSSDVSFSPEQSGTYLQPPISCDSLDQRDRIKINEIFPGNEKYPPYIELAVHENIGLDMLSISGDLLATGIEYSFASGGTTLEKNTLLLLSATGFWQSEGIESVQNGDFSLLSTGHWLLITIGSGQSRRVLDIIYLSGNILGTSSYFGSTSQQCVRIMDVLDEFSPGFEKRFLKYFPLTTITKIEYIQTDNGNQSGSVSCQVPGVDVPFSGDIPVSTDISTIIHEYTIRIVDIEYDPKGVDTNNEKITLLASNISGNQSPLDLSKVFRLKVNGTNKILPRVLPMDVPTTFTKTFGFPNSTKSGEDVIVSLVYGDHIFDTYTYNPKKLSSTDKEALTSTGYTVSSVLDGDTLRIKYQGKTQSVRLLGIDAPESTKTRYKYLECFGTEAKNYLKSLVDKKKITFQFDASQDQKDIYDRLLAYVFLDDELINQTMIENGYAKEYTYKTAYSYQSQFRQAEQSAQDLGMGLWNQSTCGVSLSGIVLTGDLEASGTVLNLSGLQFTISYVLPNPKGSDKAEELGLVIFPTPALPIPWRGGSENVSSLEHRDIDFVNTGVAGGGEMDSRFRENEDKTKEGTGTSPENRVPVTQLDLSQGFSLRIGTSKKKIEGIVKIGQENILSGSLGLVNKAACVSLFYEEQELTKFCYGKPKEGEKIYASNQGLAETLQENLDILNVLQLKRIGNQLCIRYKEQSFLCKRIPASKAEIKATQEQKLYKGFASLIKQYIITNWKDLYYDTPLKTYFDLVAQNKKLIAGGISHVDIYGQSLLITDLKGQLKVMETTLPAIIALFVGAKALMSQ